MSRIVEGDNLPEGILCHYTSISSFASILKTKKIKFSRLDCVNDPDEASTDDNVDLKKLVFASCWSFHECEDDESYPLWKMYTNNKGIRIQIDYTSYPFKKRKIKKKNKPLFYNIEGPNEIIYRKENKINAISINEDANSGLVLEEVRLLDKEVGLVKNKFWEGEKEYRFRILNIPNKLIHVAVRVEAEPMICETLEYGKLTKLTRRKSLFVELKRQFFKNLKVKLGPHCEMGDEVIVKTLMEKYLGHSELSWSKNSKNYKGPLIINADNRE